MLLNIVKVPIAVSITHPITVHILTGIIYSSSPARRSERYNIKEEITLRTSPDLKGIFIPDEL